LFAVSGVQQMIETKESYSRLDPIDDRITAAIAQNPGAMTVDIAAAAGIKKETARYRLLTLELEGVVHSVKERKYRHYFVNFPKER
jgi:predicted transcriptional regulator